MADISSGSLYELKHFVEGLSANLEKKKNLEEQLKELERTNKLIEFYKGKLAELGIKMTDV
jgi:cell shape-determining protein MreC